MEGVPRIPMISFPMKRSGETPNFKGRLKAYILEHYNEEPESYNQEINELESLRAGAVHISRDYTGCSTQKKYICQLNFLKSRFPLQEGSHIAISFSWFDVYSETAHGWSDIDFEMSSILYNIGALHCELGALDSRQTVDGMKNACTHFQCAAWAFQHLRYNYQKFFTPDISTDTLSIITNICLAQAQECVLEKSLVENRKSTITAKVSLQIVEYYQLALKTSDQLLKDSAQYSDKLLKAVKKWRKLVELKISYYSCLSYLYRGLQSEDDTKWGERVTFYKAAVDKLNESIKISKSLDKTDTVHETLSFTLDVVAGKLSVSEKENEFVYHEKVPELDSIVSDIKGVSLVKGIPFKFDDPEIAGPDIFGRLVPMEAHEASSLYSEEKAIILRTYSKKIEEKNEALDKFLIALQLDQLDLHSEGHNRLPQELVDCCAALSVNQDAVKRLSESMSKLSGMYHDTEANLQEILQLLNDQESREKEFQDIVGKRPPSNVITELSREVHKYQSAHSVAADSNQTLHEAMSQHVINLGILMKPLEEVLKHIPSANLGEADQDAIRDMQRLKSKIDEMRKQREMLECQLRDSIHKDDITKQLVVKKDQERELVFQEELKKHDKITSILDQNLLAQENIIRAMTETNANYANTRKAMVAAMHKREEVIQCLLSSYDAYDELLSKCNKGIEFYTKLDANVNKLLQRVKGVCKVQDEDREQALQSVIKKSQVNSPANMNNAAANNTMNYGGMLPVSEPTSAHPKLKDYLKAMNASKNIPVSANNMDNSRAGQEGAYNAQQASSMYTHPQSSWNYANYQTPSPAAPSALQTSISSNVGPPSSTAASTSQATNYPMQNYQRPTVGNYSQPHVQQQQHPATKVGANQNNLGSQQGVAGVPYNSVPVQANPVAYGQQGNWNYPSNYQGQTPVGTLQQAQTDMPTATPTANVQPSQQQHQTPTYAVPMQNYQGNNQATQPYQQQYVSQSTGQNVAYTQPQVSSGYGQQGTWSSPGYQNVGQQSDVGLQQIQNPATSSSSSTAPSSLPAGYMQTYANQATYVHQQQQPSSPAVHNGTGGGYAYTQSSQQQQQQPQTYNQSLPPQTGKMYGQTQQPYSSYGVNSMPSTSTAGMYVTPQSQPQQGAYSTNMYSANTSKTSSAYPYSYPTSYSQYPSQSQPQTGGMTAVPGNYYYPNNTSTSADQTYGQSQTQIQSQQQQYYNSSVGNVQQSQQQPQPVYNQPSSANTTSVANNNHTANNYVNNIQGSNRQTNIDLLSSIDFGAPNVEPLAPTPVSQTTGSDK